jgi:hypothetical protein
LGRARQFPAKSVAAKPGPQLTGVGSGIGGGSGSGVGSGGSTIVGGGAGASVLSFLQHAASATTVINNNVATSV